MRPLVLSLGVVLGLFFAPPAASANAPAPPGLCGDAGERCYAAPDYRPGTCVKQKCSRNTPNGTVKYDCVVCVPNQSDKPNDKPKT